MAGYYGLENKEVIRIKVKKCDGLLQPEYKKFSIDPQITSFEMLQGILARAFNIKSDFTISYLAKTSDGQEIYLSMLSDWDMDAACQCASEPYLKLKVDLKPFEEGLEDWDIITLGDIPQLKVAASMFEKNSFLGTLTGSITSHMERTFSQVQKAIGLKPYDDESIKPLKPAMTDMEFHNYLDPDGHLIRPQELRLSIYQGGIESSLRKVVWRHLLNIFPDNMSGKERYDYLKKKELEYYRVRDQWKEHLVKDTAADEIKNVISVVKKDVLRTDRTYKFYSGSDDSKNIVSLFHILVTYAVTHPEISYCQGMSDLASPLLVVQNDEAHAYLCFCGLMKHMRTNFHPSGQAMKTKLQHLSLLLQVYDPCFFSYLKESSTNHLFCFRWLLLALKREFPLDDALYMLEVMWSTLPPDPPVKELEITDPHYSPHLLASSPASPTLNFPQNVYANFLAMRLNGPATGRNPPPQTLNYDQSKKTNNTKGGLPPTCLNNNNTSNNNSSKSLIRVHGNKNNYDISPMEESCTCIDFPAMEDATAKMMQARSSSIDKSLCSSPPPIIVHHNSDENTPVVENCIDMHLDNGNTLDSCHEAMTFLKDDDEETHFQLSIDAGERANSMAHKSQTPKSPLAANQIYSPAMEMKKIKQKPKPVPLSLGNISTNISTGQPSLEGQTIDDDTEYEDANCSEGSQTTTPTQTSNQQENQNAKITNSHNFKASPNSPSPSQQRLSISSASSSSSQMVTPSESPASADGPEPPSLPCSPPPAPPSSDVPPLPLPPSTVSTSTSSASSCSSPLPPLPTDSSPSSTDNSSLLSRAGNIMSTSVGSPTAPHSAAEKNNSMDRSQRLPPPQDFGAGNPFLMFLCLTILLQHRDMIMSKKLECEEIDMYFQKMTRKHNVYKVLNQARTLYSEYLRNQQKLEEEFSSIEGSLSI